VIEEYLTELTLSREPGLDAAMTYPLAGGGKRIRPRLTLAAARAGGAEPATALPAAAAVELIHTFSLVHDDLPALDDDDERRGRPSLHVAHGEAVAILAGDGLLNAAFRLAGERLDAPAEVRLRVVAELAAGVAGMIDGQFLDVAGPEPDEEGLVRLHRLKTGSLISAAVACGLHVAGLDDEAQKPYRAFAAELGLLFQIVDDILDAGTDEWGYVRSHGLDGARRLAEETRAGTLELLGRCDGTTDELAQIVAEVADQAA
jgi:geranylgeranyl diphosphate synthase, type II